MTSIEDIMMTRYYVLEYYVSPRKPLFASTLVDAAEKLGVIDEYWRLVGKGEIIKADNMVASTALKYGYDSIIRDYGVWVQVLDESILKPIQR